MYRTQPRDTPFAVLAVTGGSRGIGACVVRGALTRGYRVVFSYASDDSAARALCDEAGGRASAIQGDVADPGFAPRLFDHAAREFGPVTALVNNAGATYRVGPFATAPLGVIRRTLDVNLLGTLLVAQEAVRRWQAGGIAGRMVNISSSAAVTGSPGEYVQYAAAKAGVEAFTVGLGREVAGAGIRVNAVSPGTTATDIHAAAGDPDRANRIAPRVPLGRVARPEEIADTVLWLLSDEASYVTATVLRVTGGL